jgi:hypothetical protein
LHSPRFLPEVINWLSRNLNKRRFAEPAQARLIPMPAVPRLRRRFQFSLRMLMVVVTATCVVGGILRWLTPVSPLYACVASIWAATAAVVICQFDLRNL